MTYATDLVAIQAESGGLMHMQVIRPLDLLPLLSDALKGDPDAIRLAKVVTSATVEIESAPPDRPKLCGTCPAPLVVGRFSIVIATPAVDKPEGCLFLGICCRCATDPDAIRRRAIEAVRKTWPDARPVTITSARTGHA